MSDLGYLLFLYCLKFTGHTLDIVVRSLHSLVRCFFSGLKKIKIECMSGKLKR